MVLPVPNPTKSYWIEAAQSPLKDWRSTPELPNQTDIVIIGSGYTGATAAYWIHKHTAEHGTTPHMVMLEARDICGGATGRNGGQLRPHAYSRYLTWTTRFGKEGGLALIKHEMAHLDAFRDMLTAEGIADDVSFRLGETFDAAMTPAEWARLKSNYDAFVKDHGPEADVIRDCRIIEDPNEAEAFTQMKGCVGAVVHPSGQVWPYKFVHALLKIVAEKTGKLNVQAHTPALQVSERDAEGYITVTTPRGSVRAKAVIHSTNAWASHLLPEYKNIILPSLSTVAALKAPADLLKCTGAQQWGGEIWNYHLQIPPPYNAIIVGGAKCVITHYPRDWIKQGDDSKHLPGVADYMRTWGAAEVFEWPQDAGSELALPAQEGGSWTGLTSPTADAFPFVGAVPGREGHFIAAGFGGHGMPRILLSTAHLAPIVLAALGVQGVKKPAMLDKFPSMPQPFVPTAERVESLKDFDVQADIDADVKEHEAAAKLDIANGPRAVGWKTAA
ncbi:FAD dependent oxidoreductase superfamily [Coniella lustricola]|uniref:FAD dependent oxidoreductase superfamily n=1 Tax=Coniella lustricola TaxID=2025994 RepID=A0A2T2ZV07_9PEZI|nr:FAD dependent oxidoreductase superfamily [Coniella lustricola]